MSQSTVQDQEPTTANQPAVTSDAAPVQTLGVPDARMADAYGRWLNQTQDLKSMAYNMVSQYPGDRSARLFLAEVLQAAGNCDLALDEWETLRVGASPNMLPRIEQAIEQCLADKRYFPPEYAKRLTTGEYAEGPNAARWRKYGRADIQRGREIVRLLRHWKPLAGKRVLDVGCGDAGMMICMAEQGAEVVGVEIEPTRAKTGIQRLKDLQITADCSHADICAPGTAERLGKFDVITCQDVLEHVMDPTETIRTISSMLKPDGIIYMQVPNKWGAQQLMCDHHYSLVGITALSRKQAIEYWQHATHEVEPAYGVGYPRAERYYTKAFARCGVTLKPVDHYGSVGYVEWFARDVEALAKRAQDVIFPGLRPELEKKIRHRISKAVQLYVHASQMIAQMQSQPDQSAACDYLVRRLGLPLWKFVGVKEGK